MVPHIDMTCDDSVWRRVARPATSWFIFHWGLVFKKPTLSFSEVRHLHSKTHAVLCDQSNPSLVTGAYLGRSLVASSQASRLTGLNGVRRGYRPIGEPFQGPVGNLAHSLQEFKGVFSDESLMCMWCSALMWCSAKQFETDRDRSDVLRLLWGICNHVSASTHAQGQLAALSQVIQTDENTGPGLRRPRCLWNHFQSLPHIFLKEWPGRAKPMGTPHVWSPYRPCATAKFWTESFAAPNWHSYWHCLFPCCLCGLATQPGHSFSMLLRWCFFDLSEDDGCTAVAGGAYKNSQDLDVLFGMFFIFFLNLIHEFSWRMSHATHNRKYDSSMCW